MTIVDVILVDFVDLDGRVLRINLAFNERLENLRNPNIETNLAFGRDDFKTLVFLDSARIAEFVLVAQNTVK